MNRSVSVKRAHFPRLLLLNKASPHAMDSLGRNAFRHAKMAGYDLPQLEICSVLRRIRWSFSDLVLFQPCKSYKPPQNLRQSETCFWAGHWFSKIVQILYKVSDGTFLNSDAPLEGHVMPVHVHNLFSSDTAQI
jgi:hypothetical protein